jgi:hypothetical protein
MTFTRVLRSDHTSDTATLHMLGTDEKRYSMTLTAEAVSQVQAALLLVGPHLREGHSQGQHGVAIEARGLHVAWPNKAMRW